MLYKFYRPVLTFQALKGSESKSRCWCYDTMRVDGVKYESRDVISIAYQTATRYFVIYNFFNYGREYYLFAQEVTFVDGKFIDFVPNSWGLIPRDIDYKKTSYAVDYSDSHVQVTRNLRKALRQGLSLKELEL